MQKKITQSLFKNLVKQNKNIVNKQTLALNYLSKQQFCYEKHHKPFDINDDSEFMFKSGPAAVRDNLKAFRVIDLEGNLKAPEYDTFDAELLNKIYDKMIEVEEIDTILNMTQRQGKISFYMPSFGELATTIGTGAALPIQDLIYSQYREQGTLIWRGFTVEQMLNQCTGNNKDVGKGRQMPVHYGSQELNWVTVSSPLTTQVPQASGAGYAFRLNKEDRVAVTWFGEGAASEGDFHSALNFAATLECQTLFLCRNNGWAISTPTVDQYRGDGIASKAMGYGIQTYRVDGNDLLAVMHTIKQAREYIVKEGKPAFVEFMTYRVGDHSTSDHSVLYRTEEEIQSWKQNNNPIDRLGQFLKKTNKRQLNEEEDQKIRKAARAEVIRCLKQAHEEQLPNWEHLFTDVYDKLTPNLIEQKAQLKEHLEKYPNEYKQDRWAPMD